ncbi:methyltransferase-domain-containing protein [Apiospora aurea]|uniref:Methyltransferase-domain-containing protein n=1 Tax=Apiospora aurea TaxID=335848 RepID=A0ABR1Q1U9_9PEZI
MTDSDIDQRLVIFRRQYLQLFEPDFLAWPPLKLLKIADVQTWLYKNLFDASRVPHLPPPSYQARVLKLLIVRIEKAIEEQDVVADALTSYLGSLMTDEKTSGLESNQQKPYVTFTCIKDGSGEPESTVTILERRHLVSGSKTTGFRTWEGALHLATYLLSAAGQDLIRGKKVLELGAGTGFLAILCGKQLAAKHVTTTDGDEGVVEALKENVALNGLDEKKVEATKLWWGDDLKGTWVECECETEPYDVVVGADITYEPEAIKSLVSTLRQLFDLRPNLLVIIAGVIRNAQTYEVFRQECLTSRFSLQEVNFPAKSIREQTSLFYAAAMPVKILRVTRASS